MEIYLHRRVRFRFRQFAQLNDGRTDGWMDGSHVNRGMRCIVMREFPSKLYNRYHALLQIITKARKLVAFLLKIERHMPY